MPDLSLDNI
jgi:hypothetical protein